MTVVEQKKGKNMQEVETGFGLVDVNVDALELGEILVTDDGVEVEVVGLDPLKFEEAPMEDEDWGE